MAIQREMLLNFQSQFPENAAMSIDGLFLFVDGLFLTQPTYSYPGSTLVTTIAILIPKPESRPSVVYPICCIRPIQCAHIKNKPAYSFQYGPIPLSQHYPQCCYIYFNITTERYCAILRHNQQKKEEDVLFFRLYQTKQQGRARHCSLEIFYTSFQLMDCTEDIHHCKKKNYNNFI